jgi:Outer membrane protein beta-barrel domain
MKKGLLVLALTIVSFANAQKGSVLLAGSIGYNDENSGDFKNSSFNFNPKVGYQFTDNLTAGLESSIGNNKNNGGTITTFVNGFPVVASITRTSNSLKLGAFLRYSQPLGGIFSVYGDLSAGMLSNKNSSNIPGSTDVKSNGFYAGLTPAIYMDMNKGFGINFSLGGLGYSSVKSDATGAESVSNFNFNFGSAFAVGVSKNF